MALYSYKFTDIALPTIAISCESGEPLQNLHLLRDEATGVSVNEGAYAKLFKRLESDGLRNLPHLEPDVRDATKAKAHDVANGLVHYVTGKPGTEPKAVVDVVRAFLAGTGHALLERERKGTIHFEVIDGEVAITCLGHHIPSALNLLSKCGVPFTRGASFNLPSGRHRIQLPQGANILGLVPVMERFSAENSALSLIDHTGSSLLRRSTEVAVTQPTLRTGSRGVEVHPVCGNAKSVLSQSSENTVLGRDSLMLRGTKTEIHNALKALLKIAGAKLTDQVPPPVARRFDDVLEKSPQAVIASDATAILSRKLTHQHASEEQTRAVEDFFRGSKVTFSPAQLAGVAFMANRDAALLADSTGGGKTIMAAAAATMSNPLGKKTLVVCPPGLIPQWVHQMSRYFPGESSEAARLPDWFERLPSEARNNLLPQWARVHSRFVFLPESALESGAEYSRGTVKAAADRKDSTMAIDAADAIKCILQEPIHTLIVDEGHEFRVGGPKYRLLASLRDNRVKGALAEIKKVIISSATPMHRSAADLYAMFGLLGVKKIAKMDIAEFCKDYCQPKLLVKNGDIEKAPPIAPYGYGMIKEDKIPEVTKLLSEFMIARPIEEIAPGKTLPKIIESPLPYEPSPVLGVELDNIRQAGTLVTIPRDVTAKLNDRGLDYASRQQALADAKVGDTVAKVAEIIPTLPKGQKVVVFTEKISTSRLLSETFAKVGIPSFRLSSAEMVDPDNRSIGTKGDFVQAVRDNSAAPVVVMTNGAGGTGIDGLHYASRTAVFNDFTPISGRNEQAEGRVWRVFQDGIPGDTSPVRAIYMVGETPTDIRNFKDMIEHRHESEFIRKQGMLQLMDGEVTLASNAMDRKRMEEDILALVGEKPAKSQTWARLLAVQEAEKSIDGGDNAFAAPSLDDDLRVAEQAAKEPAIEPLRLF